jgi:inositol-phosphate phosphatase/L-galactose 1-phosphate phosphatase/histidinol-phosphatase
MYGCDCYAYGLLAAGHCDLVVEADLKPYDYMALVPIIEVGWVMCGSIASVRHYGTAPLHCVLAAATPGGGGRPAAIR